MDKQPVVFVEVFSFSEHINPRKPWPCFCGSSLWMGACRVSSLCTRSGGGGAHSTCTSPERVRKEERETLREGREGEGRGKGKEIERRDGGRRVPAPLLLVRM